ncbi:MAG: DUF4349 domain-containing protein, partial [Acidimicrobiia bacterium]|nr:DUF4349 domain-containing protein [Acidimicrobiia bacterium]
MPDTNRTPAESRRRRLIFVLLAVLSAFFVLFAACGANGDDDAGAAAPADYDMPAASVESTSEGLDRPASDDAPMEEAASEEVAIVETVSDDGGLAVPTALTPADLGRDIIYTAEISVQAEDVEAASREAVAIVQRLGGIVFSQ